MLGGIQQTELDSILTGSATEDVRHSIVPVLRDRNLAASLSSHHIPLISEPESCFSSSDEP